VVHTALKCLAVSQVPWIASRSWVEIIGRSWKAASSRQAAGSHSGTVEWWGYEAEVTQSKSWKITNCKTAVSEKPSGGRQENQVSNLDLGHFNRW